MSYLPKISIIILNYNGIKDTERCVKSLLSEKYQNKEILLVDNGSENDECSILKKRFLNKNIRFYRLNKNLGFTGGNNWVLPKIRGKYILFLNNDTIVTNKFLAPLVKRININRNLIAVQPKVKLIKDKSYFDYSGACGGFIDHLGYPFTQGRIFETLEKDFGQYDNIKEIFWASGVALLIRKDYLSKIGSLFDDDFFNYMEEIDFCWSSLRAGFKVEIVPESVIFHKVAGSASKNLILKRMLEHRNNLMILVKHAPLSGSLILTRLILEMSSYILYLIRGRIDFFIALLWAHSSFLVTMPRSLKKRAILKKFLPIKSWNQLPVFHKSIVWQYFILNKRCFKDLNWSE